MSQTIIQICPWYWPHVGGVETHVRMVNEIFRQDGYDVTVLCLQAASNEPLKQHHAGVNIVRFPLAGRPPAGWRYKVWMWQQLWRQRHLLAAAQVIQVHDVFWWLWPVYGLVRGKLWMTFHGWETVYPVQWQAKLQRWIASSLSQGSLHVGAWIQEFYWDRPTAVVYGGCKHSQSSSLPRPVPTPSQQQIIPIVFLGRLSLENEVATYIDLIQWLQQRGWQLEVTWLGDGPERKQCEKWGRVMGMVRDPVPMLRPAQVVWASSYLSILQAQALGKVVCAPYSHPLKKRYLETYPGSTYMVLGKSASEIGKQLEALWNHPNEWQEKAHSAAQWAATQTWDQVAHHYYHIWKQS